MILPILRMLVSQLSDYIRQESNSLEEPPVVLGNVGLSEGLGGNEGYMNKKVVLSVVNIMEETTLKNYSQYVKNGNQMEVFTPPAFLNLFLLFTANFNCGGNANDDTDYSNGIVHLSQIIEFFQSKNIFTVRNSPSPNTLFNPDLQNVRVNIELLSLTFEQINQLWGSLGGKQLPFVLYKAGILQLKREYALDRVAYIQNIKTDITVI